jgi:hypothetical protein
MNLLNELEKNGVTLRTISEKAAWEFNLNLKQVSDD